MFCTLFLLFFTCAYSLLCVYMYFYPFPSWGTYYETLTLTEHMESSKHIIEKAVFIHQTRDTLNRGCGSLPAEYENLFEKGWTLADPSLS